VLAQLKKTHPDGVRLSALALQVFERLEKFTAFPWTVLQTQCARATENPADLGPGGLRTMLPALCASVARYAGPAKGEELRVQLELLLASIERQES
jgi:hypothetical protein